MSAGSGAARTTAGKALGPVDRRLLHQAAVRRTVAVSVAIGMVSAATVAVQAIALATLLAGAMGGTVEHPLASILWLAGAVAVRGLCALATEVSAARGAEGAKDELRRSLVSAALVPAAGGNGMGAGDVATLAGRGLDALDAYVGRCLPDLLLAAVVPLGLVVVIGALDWVSAIIVVAAVALFPVFGVLAGGSSTRVARRRWTQVEAFGRAIADVFEGLPVLKAYGRSARQRERIAEAADGLRRASLSTLRVAFISALVLDTLASVSVAIVAVPLGLRLLSGSLRLAPALAVLIIAPEVFLPLRRASAEFHESTEGLAAARRAMDVIAGDGMARPEARTVSHGGAAVRPAAAGEAGHPLITAVAAPARGPEGRARRPEDPARVPVALRHVSLRLPGRAEPVLEGACLTIQPGEIVVLVGPNGAGKSSTLSLLLGFATPTLGSVRVDGVDLRDLDLEAWRRRLSFLSERPCLLAESLAANLRLGAPGASDDRLVAALTQVGAAELLERLPGGLDASLGEGGRSVSAGERQRIALARALLRPASLHLLDEPTAHLDDLTEATVVAALREALTGRSALIVTHRPAVIELADRVVRLDLGRFAPARQMASADRVGARATGAVQEPHL